MARRTSSSPCGRTLRRGDARSGFIKSVARPPNTHAGALVFDPSHSQPIVRNEFRTPPIVFICKKGDPVVKCDACRTCRPTQICFFHLENDVHGRSFSSHCFSSDCGVPTGRHLETPPHGFGNPVGRQREPRRSLFFGSSFSLTTPDPRASFVRIVTRRCCAASPEILLPAARIEDDSEPHLSHPSQVQSSAD